MWINNKKVKDVVCFVLENIEPNSSSFKGPGDRYP